MAVEVPMESGSLHWEQSVTLDGVPYTMLFQYNRRAGHWYLHLSDAEGAPIGSSLRLVINLPLLRRLHAVGGPPGELILVDESSSPRDPQRDDLGVRHRLYYLDAAELAVLDAEIAAEA